MEVQLRHPLFQFMAGNVDHHHFMGCNLDPHRRGRGANGKVARTQHAFAAGLTLLAKTTGLEVDQQPLFPMVPRAARHDRRFRPRLENGEIAQRPTTELT